LKKYPKIALALGGGGARGCAHIGVIKGLEREGIFVDMIAGTSIGAVVGAIYAKSRDSAAVEQRFLDFLKSEEFRKSGLDLFKRREPVENFFGQVASIIKKRVVVNLAQSKTSLVGGKRLERAMQFLIPEGRLENTEIPFYAVASDILNGKQVIFESGEMRDAVTASASIPGFVPGSVVCPIPVEPLRERGADIVIAVDVGQDLNEHASLENVIDVIFQTNHMTARHYNLHLLKQSDVVIRPNVGLVHWSEFKLLHYMIEEGERITQKMIPEIRETIGKKTRSWKKMLKIA